MIVRDEAPHARLLRRGRVSQSGRIYLVTTVTATREPLFLNFCVGRVVVDALRWLQNQARATTLAYVLMPDHLHWLFELQEASTLSRVMHSLKSYSARQINRLLGREGSSVWQTGFHDHAVRREEDIIKLARYVVENPLRAGLVRRIEDYPHWDEKWL